MKKHKFNFKMFVITTELPDGKNYFCNIYNMSPDEAAKSPGIVPGIYNEWDTNKGFARRFRTHAEATNFLNVVIRLDGCKVEEMEHVANGIIKPFNNN